MATKPAPIKFTNVVDIVSTTHGNKGDVKIIFQDGDDSQRYEIIMSPEDGLYVFESMADAIGLELEIEWDA